VILRVFAIRLFYLIHGHSLHVCKEFFTICSANWVIGHYSHGIKNLFTTHVRMLLGKSQRNC